MLHTIFGQVGVTLSPQQHTHRSLTIHTPSRSHICIKLVEKQTVVLKVREMLV